MRITCVVVALVATLSLVGCSSESDAPEVKRLVPTKASEITSSPDYKFERTTKSGIQCYIRQLSPEIVASIAADSPDRQFLTTGKEPYFLVPIKNDKILKLNKDESAEVTAIMVEKIIEADPEYKKILGSGGRKQ